jgi:hypothetical protein
MSRARKVPELAWEFVVGDDWRLAAAAVVAIGGAAILVALGVNAWWWAPALVAATLWVACAGRGSRSSRRPRLAGRGRRDDREQDS